MGLIKPMTEGKADVTIAVREGKVLLVMGDQPLLNMPPEVAREVGKLLLQKADEAEGILRLDGQQMISITNDLIREARRG